MFNPAGDIALPARITEAMQMQVEAERKKRAAILESEGQREAEINVAEGRKRARILASGTNTPRDICAKCCSLCFNSQSLLILVIDNFRG